MVNGIAKKIMKINQGVRAALRLRGMRRSGGLLISTAAFNPAGRRVVRTGRTAAHAGSATAIASAAAKQQREDEQHGAVALLGQVSGAQHEPEQPNPPVIADPMEEEAEQKENAAEEEAADDMEEQQRKERLRTKKRAVAAKAKEIRALLNRVRALEAKLEEKNTNSSAASAPATKQDLALVLQALVDGKKNTVATASSSSETLIKSSLGLLGRNHGDMFRFPELKKASFEVVTEWMQNAEHQFRAHPWIASFVLTPHRIQLNKETKEYSYTGDALNQLKDSQGIISQERLADAYTEQCAIEAAITTKVKTAITDINMTNRLSAKNITLYQYWTLLGKTFANANLVKSSQYLVKMLSMKQGDKESFSAFENRVQIRLTTFMRVNSGPAHDEDTLLETVMSSGITAKYQLKWLELRKDKSLSVAQVIDGIKETELTDEWKEDESTVAAALEVEANASQAGRPHSGKIRCHKCRNHGHAMRDCPQLKAANARFGERNSKAKTFCGKCKRNVFHTTEQHRDDYKSNKKPRYEQPQQGYKRTFSNASSNSSEQH